MGRTTGTASGQLRLRRITKYDGRLAWPNSRRRWSRITVSSPANRILDVCLLRKKASCCMSSRMPVSGCSRLPGIDISDYRGYGRRPTGEGRSEAGPSSRQQPIPRLLPYSGQVFRLRGFSAWEGCTIFFRSGHSLRRGCARRSIGSARAPKENTSCSNPSAKRNGERRANLPLLAVGPARFLPRRGELGNGFTGNAAYQGDWGFIFFE